MVEQFTHADYVKLAEKTTLPFDLGNKISQGKSVLEVFNQEEEEQKYCIQVLLLLRELKELFFIKTLDEMPALLNASHYLFRDVATWRLELSK